MPLLDLESAQRVFYEDVVAGLNDRPRTLPCKYFYDERGSKLFDQICDLDEYYLTRTELAIMEQYAGEMAEQIGPGVMLIEYGSGSSVKTRILLDHLDDPIAYIPVDISGDHLEQTAMSLADRYPEIEILPVAADFTTQFSLPVPRNRPTHNAVYFPGSTIGNFRAEAAKEMLERIVRLCGCGGGLLIGIDLQKDTDIIEQAYNDSEGVTAEFNLNLLHRINRELDADIQVDQFAHQANYDEREGRVEIDLVSRREQSFTVGEESFSFAHGEAIRTEYSCKYTVEGFAELAASAGLELHKYWTDADRLFAVLHLVIPE